jgi:CheY-like chemotaxis protein
VQGAGPYRWITVGREGTHCRVPIIATTAEAMEGCRENCLASGQDDDIAKPVKLNDLVAALRKWAPGKLRSAPV